MVIRVLLSYTFSFPPTSLSPAMSIIAHISVFISLILGLAVVHLLGGISLMIDTRVKTSTYWIHTLWVVNMLFAVVLVWLSSFVLSPLSHISALHFLTLLAYSVATYLMSGLLFPIEGVEITNFEAHFSSNRFRFYMLGLFFTLVDASDGLLEYLNTNLPLDVGQFATLSAWFTLFLFGMVINKKWMDILIVCVFSIGLIGWFHSLIDTEVLSW